MFKKILFLLALGILLTACTFSMKKNENLNLEKYHNDQYYCEKDSDCAIQKNCSCCNRVKNIYNIKEVNCKLENPDRIFCDVECPKTFDIACENNKCKKVNEKY
ncbi:hypothetical protein K8R66_03820 [bacterium]|nr:hypothetical protein [bacterium]